jgi:hypothetical protein
MDPDATLVDAETTLIGSVNRRFSVSRNDSEAPLDPNVTARPGHGDERRGALVPGIPLPLGTPAVTKGSLLAISFPSVPQASEGEGAPVVHVNEVGLSLPVRLLSRAKAVYDIPRAARQVCLFS